MNDKQFLEKLAIEYADKQYEQTIDPLMHSMIKAAVCFGWELAMDRVYKTKFVRSQSLEDYIGGNENFNYERTPDDEL